MKKLLAALLCVMMVACFMPTMAFAEGEGTGTINSVDALKAAIESAEGETTIVLAGQIEVTETIDIPAGKVITLDLNGYAITGTFAGNDNNPVIDTEGTLTIKDTKAEEETSGKIVSNKYGVSASHGGTIIVESGVITSEYACLTSNNTTGIGNFIINGGTLTSNQSEAIYMPAQGDLLMTAGTLNGGISARMGNITIEGGTINAMTGATDAIEDYYNYSGSVWLGDAIFVMAGTYNFEDGNDCNITITGGTINGNQKSGIGIYNIYTKEDQDVNVKITGGNINGGNINGGSLPAVKVYSGQEISTSTSIGTKSPDTEIVVTGGTFSDDSAKDYIPADTEVVRDDGTGRYVLKPAETAVAKIGNVGYSTLQAAIDAAGPSDTVKLLKDISLDVTLNVNKTIKLDGADGSVNHIISAGEVFQSGQLVNFYGDGSVVKNITFDSANKAKGVQTYAKNVAAALSFENVVIKNSVGSGMTVNGTTTTIKNATFEGNTWQDVNVDSGNGVTNDSKLIIDSGCNFKSTIQIASDGQVNSDPLKYGSIELKDTTKVATEKMDGTKKIWTITSKPSTGGYYPTTPTIQNPTIEASEGVTVIKGATGTTATITVADGYELVDVTVNGVSKGKVTTLTGLKTGDKVVVTAQKIVTVDDNAAAIEAVKSVKLVARSQMSKAQGKKAVKITWYASDGSEVKLDGVEIFRSTKRYSGFGTKPIFSTIKAQYHNTAIEVGTKYYYKVRGYKMIGGEKIYTEWSTKAWRTVK